MLWLVSGLAECLTWYKNLGPPFIGLPKHLPFLGLVGRFFSGRAGFRPDQQYPKCYSSGCRINSLSVKTWQLTTHISIVFIAQQQQHHCRHCFTWIEHQQVVRFSMLALNAGLYDATKDEHFPATAACAVSITRWQVIACIHFLPCQLDTWYLTISIAAVTATFAFHNQLILKNKAVVFINLQSVNKTQSTSGSGHRQHQRSC